MHVLLNALSLLLALICAMPVSATSVDEVFRPYAKLLERHVAEHELASGGLVSSFDYRAAMADSESIALIRRQRKRLAGLESDEFENREASIAFWINAYNFFMIVQVIGHPEDGEPVDSVRDFGSLFNPFRVFTQKRFNVAGRQRSLDQIEKKILLGESFGRRGWKDARVHFAVNCASLGCPPLRSQPYTAENVDRLLEENTHRALLTPLHLEINASTARLSSLFDWYASDFEHTAGSVASFIENHLGQSRRAAFESTDEIVFIDYDWRLNSPANINRWLASRR